MFFIFAVPKQGIVSSVTCTDIAADVVELVDMLDLGSSAARRAGSIPVIRTKLLRNEKLFYFRYFWVF